jgi:hypothetical protein
MHDRYSWSPFSFVFLFTYKDNGFPAIFFTSSKLYHTICRMNHNRDDDKTTPVSFIPARFLSF